MGLCVIMHNNDFDVLLDGSLWSFVCILNTLSLIGMQIFKLVGVIFHIVIKVQSDDNKHNSFVSVFTQCVHAMQDTREKSLDFTVETSQGAKFHDF